MLFVAVFSVELALKFTAAPEKLAVPAPLTEDPALKLKVPPEKLSVAPEAALKPAASVPPPEKFSCVPVFTVTVPVLLSATPIVSLVPPVICNVPALLNAGATPPLKIMPFPTLTLPFTMLQVAPARLFTTAPLDRNRPLPPVAFPNVVVPATFSVRVLRDTLTLGTLIPPLALVPPAPFIVPPVQVSRPVRAAVPVPDRAPPLRFVAPCTVLAPLSVSVPPLTFKALANVAAPVTVSGPDVKLIVELATKLAMVWLAAARPPMVMVEHEKVVWIQTLSVAIGTAALLQLPAVPHWLSPAAPVHRLAPAAQPAVAPTDKTTEVGV